MSTQSDDSKPTTDVDMPVMCVTIMVDDLDAFCGHMATNLHTSKEWRRCTKTIIEMNVDTPQGVAEAVLVYGYLQDLVVVMCHVEALQYAAVTGALLSGERLEV